MVSLRYLGLDIELSPLDEFYLLLARQLDEDGIVTRYAHQ
jgi:hypothetical protein